jgi:hypothetical protein
MARREAELGALNGCIMGQARIPAEIMLDQYENKLEPVVS